jgi:hypothetical protein
MYARVTTTQGNPDMVDEALEIVRNSILPAARSQKGFKGYLLLGDRATGKSFGITIWETETDRDATSQDSEYLRENLAKLAPLFSAQPIIEDFEVLIQE